MSNDSHRVFRGINIFCFFFPLACSFDFEDGIGGWERRGTAFIYQPTFGDNPAERNRENARQQGDWWMGGGLRIDPAKTIQQDGSTQIIPTHP